VSRAGAAPDPSMIAIAATLATAERLEQQLLVGAGGRGDIDEWFTERFDAFVCQLRVEARVEAAVVPGPVAPSTPAPAPVEQQPVPLAVPVPVPVARAAIPPVAVPAPESLVGATVPTVDPGPFDGDAFAGVDLDPSYLELAATDFETATVAPVPDPPDRVEEAFWHDRPTGWRERLPRLSRVGVLQGGAALVAAAAVAVRLG
jgi:hypothetical protein